MFGEDNPKGMPDHLFFGAQRMDYDTAERADISRQHYFIATQGSPENLRGYPGLADIIPSG
jgi:hypothetical protein